MGMHIQPSFRFWVLNVLFKLQYYSEISIFPKSFFSQINFKLCISLNKWHFKKYFFLYLLRKSFRNFPKSVDDFYWTILWWKTSCSLHVYQVSFQLQGNVVSLFKQNMLIFEIEYIIQIKTNKSWSKYNVLLFY